MADSFWTIGGDLVVDGSGNFYFDDVCCCNDPCWEINNCTDDETRYVPGAEGYAVGKYFIQSSDCWKIVAYHTTCPQAPLDISPGLDFYLPSLTVCSECACGCYERVSDIPGTIDVVIAGSSCSALNGTYNNVPYVEQCKYYHTDGGVFIYVELGRPNTYGDAGAPNMANGTAQAAFEQCWYTGSTACGGQTMTDNGAGDPCCTGGTMAFTMG